MFLMSNFPRRRGATFHEKKISLKKKGLKLPWEANF
jgi:hypothetical protein